MNFSCREGRQVELQILLWPQVSESVESLACGFLAASKPWAAVNREAGNFRSQTSLPIFVAAKEFVALDGGNHADGAFFARLGALHAAEAADAYGPGESDLVGKSQKNLNGRAFPDILGKEKVDTAGTNVP
jgi:hypothetical protein